MLVAADSARESDEFELVFFGGVERFFDENLGDGVLDRGAEVGELVGGSLAAFGVELGEGVEDGGFESREGEVEVVEGLGETLREGERFGVSGLRLFFNFGATGVGKAEHFSCFVEGFASGIVAGGAEVFIVTDAVNFDEEGVTA